MQFLITVSADRQSLEVAMPVDDEIYTLGVLEKAKEEVKAWYTKRREAAKQKEPQERVGDVTVPSPQQYAAAATVAVAARVELQPTEAPPG